MDKKLLTKLIIFTALTIFSLALAFYMSQFFISSSPIILDPELELVIPKDDGSQLGTSVDIEPVESVDLGNSGGGGDDDGPPNLLPSIDGLLDKLRFASIAFNVPKIINIDDSPQIQLILSLSETVDEVIQSVIEEGAKVGAVIKVSDRMKASLTGSKFIITPITPEIQAVPKKLRTEWKWEIDPKVQGQHKLNLTLIALLEIEGRTTPRSIRTFSKDILVEVTAAQNASLFFKNNWQWLWMAILVPIAGWFWRRRSKKNNSLPTNDVKKRRKWQRN